MLWISDAFILNSTISQHFVHEKLFSYTTITQRKYLICFTTTRCNNIRKETYYTHTQFYAPTCMSSRLSARWKKPWECWHEFTMFCTVIWSIASSINASTYWRRCSPTPGRWTSGTRIRCFTTAFILLHMVSTGFNIGEYGPRRQIVERFSKHDATSKKTWKWRGRGVIFPYMDVATPFLRHFHVVFDVASCLLKLSS